MKVNVKVIADGFGTTLSTTWVILKGSSAMDRG